MLKPFSLGGISIDPPLTLAPMAGQTNHAFRRLCREQGGCGLVCTELISSKALEQKGSRQRTLSMFDWSPTEYPFAVQLFGSDPNQMAEAAALVSDYGAPIVDINMGCWVPKVAKKGGGAALLRDLSKAARVVEAVVAAVSVPVTVKVRSGWNGHEDTAVDFAVAAKQLGVEAVAVHARTAEQGFTGEADWDVIGKVKAGVGDLPVIGNGDVETAHDVEKMFRQTGCDGIMIGRAALGRPWVFAHLVEHRQTDPPLRERARLALRQAELTLETTRLPERVALREMRGQLSRYRLDQGGDGTVRNQLVRAESLHDIQRALEPILEGTLSCTAL